MYNRDVMIVDFFLCMKMVVGVEGQKELALIWRNTIFVLRLI